jgi:hypothetical protein
MTNADDLNAFNVASAVFRLAASSAMSLIFVLSSLPATAKPEFAAKTGFPCAQCHVSQTGGGALKSFGEAFKANGYEVPKKKRGLQANEWVI